MPSKNSHGRHQVRRGVSAPKLTLASAVVAASLATGVGTAAAVPQQPGTNPQDNAAPQQPGTTVDPADHVPSEIPGPGTLPAPPMEAPYQPYTPQPQYETVYNPGTVTEAPRNAAPVRPIAPPVNKIRIGNFITDIPAGMNKRDVNSINAWAAYGEAKIAQNLIAAGVPEDEASRRAAATIIGVGLAAVSAQASARPPASCPAQSSACRWVRRSAPVPPTWLRTSPRVA